MKVITVENTLSIEENELCLSTVSQLVLAHQNHTRKATLSLDKLLIICTSNFTFTFMISVKKYCALMTFYLLSVD